MTRHFNSCGLLLLAIGALALGCVPSPGDPGAPDTTARTGDDTDYTLPVLHVAVLDQGCDACCDLGSVPIGGVAECRIKLTNPGSRALVFDEIRFADPADGVRWLRVGGPPAEAMDHADDHQFSIPPGESSTIAVQFQSSDLLAHQTRLIIRTNAPAACGSVGQFDGTNCTRRTYPRPCPTDQVGEVSVDLRAQGVNH